jgi:Coenzyme PQQ synthesis protein D (PqqD)
MTLPFDDVVDSAAAERGRTAFGDSSRFQRRPEVLWRRTANGVVLLPPDSREPLLVVGGGPLWDLLAEARELDDLVGRLTERFGVDRSEVNEAVAEALGGLVAADAVHVLSDPMTSRSSRDGH